MNNVWWVKCLAIGLVWCLTVPMARAERLRIEVGGPNFRPYPVAVPNLVVTGGRPESSASLGRDLTALLQADTELARALELVPPKTYLAPEKELWTRPTFPNWSGIGASGLIRGGLESDGKTAKMAFKFYDIASQREALSRTCVDSNEAASRCVHRFLDDVVEYLTGEKGIFSSRIAFARRVGRVKSIFTCDLDGGNLLRATENNTLNLLPAWDRSGQYLFFTSYLQENPDLYRLNLLTKQTTPFSQERGLNTGAAVSPNGKSVAVTLSRDGNTEIYVMDWNGGNVRRLTDSFGEDVSPTWSPDGTRLAFVSSRSGNPHIYVMNADGSNPKRLTFQGTYNQEPDWSPRPDGQVAFTARDETLKYDVFLVHPDTSVITRLTQDEGNNESPSFSPDGHHLAFTSTRGADSKQLWMMDIDGNNQRRIALPTGDCETPSWGPRLGYN